MARIVARSSGVNAAEILSPGPFPLTVDTVRGLSAAPARSFANRLDPNPTCGRVVVLRTKPESDVAAAFTGRRAQYRRSRTTTMTVTASSIVAPKMDARMMASRRRYSSPSGSSGDALVQTLVQTGVLVGPLVVIAIQTVYSVDG